MTYSITDEGLYQCAECEKVSATLLAHNSHYRKHKNAAAKAQPTEPVATPARTLRTVVMTAQQPTKATVTPEPKPQPEPPQEPAPQPKGRSWLDRLLYGDD